MPKQELKKVKSEAKPTELEAQQKSQIQEMDLVIKALESSNNLVNFRINILLKQNRELQEKIATLKKDLINKGEK